MAAALHVHKEVKILNEGLLRGEIRQPGTFTVSYDEKPVFRRWRSKRPTGRPCLGSMPARHWTGIPTGAYSARFPPVAGSGGKAKI